MRIRSAMKSVRVLTAFVAVGLLCAALGRCAADEPTPLQSVRPMVGTSAHGHTFPGATVPFGMVQLSPDTRFDGWDACSGYHWSDSTIRGFSHTHISGTGCLDLGDIRVIPLSGTKEEIRAKGYYPLKFSHADELAKPGYYRVSLGDPKMTAELTATAHAGFHRYTFPADRTAWLEFDLIHGVGNQVIEAAIVAESNTVIHGYRRSHGWADDKTYYFVAEFSRPFAAFSATVDGKPVEGREAKGQRVNALLDFEKVNEPILVKVGVSPNSVEGARKNLAAEIPGWDFDAVVAAAEKSWNDLLGRIEIQTTDPALRETFYSALYHVGTAPTLFNDADGSYRGLDRKVHAPAGFQNYCTFSLWDTFRAENPLLTIVQPGRVDDFVNSMLAHYREFNQHSLPVWSLAGNETWCMIGNHSIPVIVDAYLKGFRGFDAEAAYRAMRDVSMQDRNFLGEYRKLGYVASGEKKQSVSRTLEYAFNDWCVAQMAKALGKTEDAKLFEQRAQNYRNVIDRSLGFARGKLADGSWHSPFSPYKQIGDDFTEATSWNYTWFVPHDVPGLTELLGGKQAAAAKLDKMFSDATPVVAESPDLSGFVGQYVQGNEPCHHIPYLYSLVGEPWKAQRRVRQIMTDLYNNTPEGLCGNDDCGQMSAWYVFSALGFYPMNPDSGVYVLGSPAVDRATIHLDPKFHKGKTFTVVAENNSPKNVYIQSATLNGKPLEKPWITHADIAAGGELVLKMGPEPNKAWGN